MKLMIVPPAQAEALFDAWNDDDWSGDAPWRGDDVEEPVKEPLRNASPRNRPCPPLLAAPSFGPAP